MYAAIGLYGTICMFLIEVPKENCDSRFAVRFSKTKASGTSSKIDVQLYSMRK